MKCAFELCFEDAVIPKKGKRGCKPKYCKRHVGNKGTHNRYFDIKKMAVRAGFLPLPPPRKHQYRYEDPNLKPDPVIDGDKVPGIYSPHNCPTDWIMAASNGLIKFKELKRKLKGVKVVLSK